MKRPDKEQEILDLVFDQTKAAPKTIERVFDLMGVVDEHDAELQIRDGKVVASWLMARPDEIRLPQSVWDRIADLDEEIIELLEPIKAAWLEVIGHEYPEIWVGTMKPSE
jgi:hypothetical protein